MELPRAEEDFGSPTKHVVGNDSTVMTNKIELGFEYSGITNKFGFQMVETAFESWSGPFENQTFCHSKTDLQNVWFLNGFGIRMFGIWAPTVHSIHEEVLQMCLNNYGQNEQ